MQLEKSVFISDALLKCWESEWCLSASIIIRSNKLEVNTQFGYKIKQLMHEK